MAGTYGTSTTYAPIEVLGVSGFLSRYGRLQSGTGRGVRAWLSKLVDPLGGGGMLDGFTLANDFDALGLDREEWAKKIWPLCQTPKGSDCWLWFGHPTKRDLTQQPSTRSGYLRCRDAKGRRHTLPVHRLAYWLTNLKPPLRRTDLVLRTCFNPRCINPKHLRVGTVQESMRLVAAAGTKKGSNNARSLITEAQALEIRKRRAAGETGRSLAREFGVSSSTIGLLVKGQTWKHVSGPIQGVHYENTG